MDKRFLNLFNLSEEAAIALLDTPPDQVSEEDSRYIAASHLVNFPSDRSIAALMRAIQITDDRLENRIVRRKSVETLGKLKAKQALPVICQCLDDADCYTVENAVWSIGEIGTDDCEILEAMAQLLAKPNQLYRVIIHTLAKLNYVPALDRIRPFMTAADETVASAAIATVCRFTGDYGPMAAVVAFLQSGNVYTRRLAIQDLIDARHYGAIPAIARCPVSLVFRLRGIRLLAEAGCQAVGTQPGASQPFSFAEIQPYLDQVLWDRPQDLELVHVYDRLPTLDFAIRELYETDFGRCYLATQTLLEHYAAEAPAALRKTYEDEAYTDYGAHYHVVKLWGWLKDASVYDRLIQALHNREPQFQKSRAAAALALAELGDARAIPELKGCLETPIWDLKYAVLMALEQLGDRSAHGLAANDADWMVRARATCVPASVALV